MKLLRATFCVLGVLAASASAQDWTPAVRLNPAGYATINWEVSPNGSGIVLTAFKPGGYHLFISPDNGPLQLVTGPGLPVAGLLRIEFTPDGKHVLYNDVFDHVYSVPTDLSRAPLELTAPVVAGAVNNTHFVSPDGGWFVYLADQDTLGVTELYSAPVDGSAPPVKLSGSLVTGGDVTNLVRFTPDGQTVVYIADQDIDNVTELYRVPVDGSATAVKVNPALVAGGDVLSAAISPDGSTIVYRADQAVDGFFELFSVPITGGTPVTISVGRAFLYTISPDSQYVAWEYAGSLFLSPIGGGVVRALNEDVMYVSDIRFTPDGQHVVWQQTTEYEESLDSRPPPPGGFVELRSVPVDGDYTVNELLDDYPWLDNQFAGSQFKLSSDSSHLVYTFDDSGRIRSHPITGGSAELLHPYTPGLEAVYLEHKDASKRIHAFYTETDGTGFQQLFRAPIDASEPPTPISPSSTVGGLGVTKFRTDDSGRHVLYKQKDGTAPGTYETFRTVRLDSLAPAVGPPTGGTVVWLRGDGFSEETEVFFGAHAATSTLLMDEGTLIAIAPAIPFTTPKKRAKRVAQILDVTVRNVGVESTVPDGFTYVR